MPSKIGMTFFFHISYNNDKFEINKNYTKRGRLRSFSQVAPSASKVWTRLCPDFIIPNQENNNLFDNHDDDMEDILCLDSDVECENQLYHVTDNNPVATYLVIEATDSFDSESIPTRKGKKRKKNNATWKRNISKDNRAEG